MIVMLLGFVVLAYVQFADAEIQKKHIGIEFSESCLLLISVEDFETCSNPKFVKSLYPEIQLKPSYQKMFAGLAEDEKTPYQLTSAISNHQFECIRKNYCDIFMMNDNQKVIYWYDFDQKSRPYLDSIIAITPNLLHKNTDRSINDLVSNGSDRYLSFAVDRLIFNTCNKITYEPELIWLELGNIIWYVTNDCLDVLHLGSLAHPFEIELNSTEIDVTTSPNWQYQQQLEELKKKYKENRLGKD